MGKVVTTFEGNTKPQDRAVSKLQTDLARYKSQRERDEQALTRLTERNAEARARAEIRSLQSIQREIQRIRREEIAATQSTRGGGFAAALTGGAIAGGVGVGAFAILGVTKQLAAATADLGVRSVQLAADFESTQNAMKLYAGSAEGARAQLADLAKLSQNTVGLRLQDAEKGTLNLRALGFEANLAKDLISGLAKQRILSGAPADSIGRVTFNLAQLASGGGDFQDVRELITNLPTLRKELIDAFGSLQNFQAAIRSDPQDALKRLAREMANVQAPAGGLNDALGKLEDSFIQAGRAFGEPILDPLTQGIQDLTRLVHDNKDTWQQWGQSVADSIRAASDIARGAGNLNEASGGAIGRLARFHAVTLPIITNPIAFGANRGLNTLSGIGAASRLEQERIARELESRFPGYTRSFDPRTNTYQPGLPANPPRDPTNSVSARLEQEIALSRVLKEIEQERTSEIRKRASLLLGKPGVTIAELQSGLSQVGSLGLAPLDAAGLQQDFQRRIFEEQKRQADELKKKMEELKKARESAFSLGLSTSDNPFVSLLASATQRMRTLVDTTKELSLALRSALQDQERFRNLRDLTGLRLDTRLEAFSLRSQAAEFRQGYRNDLSDPATVQRILDAQLNILSGRFDPAKDQRLVNIAQGLDPRLLRQDQQYAVAGAFEREATRKLESEQQAVDFYQAMQKLITGEGLKVSVGKGATLEVQVSDQTSTGISFGTSGNVTARHK